MVLVYVYYYHYIGKIPKTKLCCIRFKSLFSHFYMKYELSHLELEQNIFKTWPHYSVQPAFLKIYLHRLMFSFSTSFMYLQYICSVLFLSLNLQKFGEKISITIIQLSQLHLHFLSYISHKRVCFWGNYANIYNPADKSLNLVRCEFWCLRLFSIHGKQTTNDNDGQTFRGLFVAWWWW